VLALVVVSVIRMKIVNLEDLFVIGVSVVSVNVVDVVLDVVDLLIVLREIRLVNIVLMDFAEGIVVASAVSVLIALGNSTNVDFVKTENVLQVMFVEILVTTITNVPEVVQDAQVTQPVFLVQDAVSLVVSIPTVTKLLENATSALIMRAPRYKL